MKVGRPKTGRNRISRTYSMSKQQIEWLETNYQGDDYSELMRQLLDDYINASTNAQPESLKLVFRLRVLQRQQEKLDVEVNGWKVALTAVSKRDHAKLDYERWRDRTEDEAKRISESDPEGYQRELERRKHLYNVAEATFQAFQDNYDAIGKQIADTEAQLLNIRDGKSGIHAKE